MAEKESSKKETKTEAKKTTSKKETKTEAKKTTSKKETKTEAKKTSEDKLKKLKEKAAKLAGKIKGELEIKKETEEKDYLVPVEDYLKASVHLGTRAITPDMRPFVYKRRADSLAVFNTDLIDKKLREAADYLSQFPPEDILVVCKREAGEKALSMFSKVTGIKTFAKHYPAGIITNPNLDNFMEVELLMICDPWIDRAAINDAKRIKIPVLAICDTNNYTMNITEMIVGNNKSAKSLGMIFYLLAKLYVEKRGIDAKVPPISEWIENWNNLIPPK